MSLVCRDGTACSAAFLRLCTEGFDPEAAGAAKNRERLMGALYVVWDEATLPTFL